MFNPFLDSTVAEKQLIKPGLDSYLSIIVVSFIHTVYATKMRPPEEHTFDAFRQLDLPVFLCVYSTSVTPKTSSGLFKGTSLPLTLQAPNDPSFAFCGHRRNRQSAPFCGWPRSLSVPTLGSVRVTASSPSSFYCPVGFSVVGYDNMLLVLLMRSCLALKSDVSVNICVKVFVGTCVFILWG